MQMINKSMVGIVKALDKALQSNNLERVAATMDQFEKQFENLDIQTEFVEGAMNNQATLSTPEEDVNILLQQVWLPSHPLLTSVPVNRCHRIRLLA
jgi:charged multivesicular body protein 1